MKTLQERGLQRNGSLLHQLEPHLHSIWDSLLNKLVLCCFCLHRCCTHTSQLLETVILSGPSVTPYPSCSLLIILSSQFSKLFGFCAYSQEKTKAGHGISSRSQQYTPQYVLRPLGWDTSVSAALTLCWEEAKIPPQRPSYLPRTHIQSFSVISPAHLKIGWVIQMMT